MNDFLFDIEDSEVSGYALAENDFFDVEPSDTGYLDADAVPLVSPEEASGVVVSTQDIKEIIDASAPMVHAWFDASKEIVGSQLFHLRHFVDWVVETYHFTEKEALPCWFRHSEFASEWMGLWHLYRLCFSSEDSGAGPNNFHYWLDASRNRFSKYRDRIRCTQTQHDFPRTVIVGVTQVDDVEWAEITGVSEKFVPKARFPRWVGEVNRKEGFDESFTDG